MIEGRHARWLALIGLLALIIVAFIFEESPGPGSGREPASRSGQARREGDRSDESARGRSRRWPALRGASQVRGRIVDSSAGPLTEGRIDLYCANSTYLISTTVGDEGEFEAPACSQGPTCVRLVHPGVEQPRAWELDAGVEIELEVDPAPSLAGTIIGPNREAVPGADLLARQASSSIALSSDGEGEFAIAFPRERPCDRCDLDRSGCRSEPLASSSERVQVFVSALGFAPLEVEVDLGADPVEIVLAPPAPALLGTVLGADGRPFEGRMRVLASNVARDHERHAAEVDAEGRFAFESLAAAEYSLRVIRDERELATLGLARPGETVELRSEQPARGSTLTVELVGADDEPIVGARVDGGPWRAAISDAEGRVEAEAVLPGIYTVRVRAGDSAPVRESIELPPGETAWLRRVRLPGPK